MPGPSQITAQDGQGHRGEMWELVGAFYSDLEQLGQFTAADASELPQRFQSLLAHDDHMTVTIEAFHESLVKVGVLEESIDETTYARKSVLTRQSDGAPVQLGVMRISLPGLPDKVRSQIREHAAPLGRILIRNNLLREVELLALWRIVPGPELRRVLGLADGQVTYGRSARILVEGKPAVELLEIVNSLE